MNTNKKSQSQRINRLARTGLWVLGLAAAIALPPVMETPAQAQSSPYSLAPQQPNFYRLDTAAFPAVLTNSGSIIITGGSTNALKLTLRQGHGLSVFINMGSGTNATTGAATLKWDVTPDGTNFTTTQPLTWTVTPGNSAKTVLAWTNFPPSVLDNVRAIQLTGLSNNFTNYWWATNLWYSYGGE